MIVLTEAALAEFWDSINFEPAEPPADLLREIADHYTRHGVTEPKDWPGQPRLSRERAERIEEN